MLQPGALSTEIRGRKRHAKKDLKERLDRAPHGDRDREPGSRSRPSSSSTGSTRTNLLMAVGTLIAVCALLSQVGDPQTFWDTITNADWAWLTVAIFISFVTNFATAISLMGSVPMPLPLVRTAELQLSMSFSNLAVPAVGGLAAQVRFLQKQGIDLASAVAAGGLLATVGNIAAQVLILIVALAPRPTQIDTRQDRHRQRRPGRSSSSRRPSSSRRRWSSASRGSATSRPAAGEERDHDHLGGAAFTEAAVPAVRGEHRSTRSMYAFVLDACIVAFGGHINYWTLLSLNIFVGTIASLVPIPGGGTAVSSVGMTGALTAVGISTEIAVAAVLANQLVANFIPAVPGWFATKNLLNDDYL